MADIAPEKTAVTLDDLMKLGEDARVEVINGVLVEMAPVGGLHHLFGGNIHDPLKAFVNERELGLVFMDGLLYLMNENTRHLRGSFVPDVSFIRRENIPASWNLSLPFPGVPDLAVEVISPGDDAEDVQTKIRTYLDKGTEQVWVAYPSTREVYQYRRDQQTVRIYRGGEQIDTESLFPGLVLTLDAIFKLPSWAANLNTE
jgi:Uma2 family endonuclease